MNDVTTTEHPKAIEAKQRAEQRRLTRIIEKNRIKTAKERFGVRFLNVGKYTICYRVDRRDVIELSTTILHPNDRHDKHIGQMQALKRFTANNRIHLKSEQGFSPKQFLQLAFSVFQ